MAALVAAACAGCASAPAGGGPGRPAAGPMMGSGAMAGMMGGAMAVATLTPTLGSTVRGVVMFHQMDGHLMVHAKLSGLAPNTEHGFHVHETGSCASADGASAGGHFNPGSQPHGPQDHAHHAGDLPSLKADSQGAVDKKFVLDGPTLGAGAASLLGRSVIVHAQPDDYTTQPSGNSGERVACGVIAAF